MANNQVYYSDSLNGSSNDDIKRLMREINVGSSKTDSITEDTITNYKQEIDAVINNAAEPYFHVPFVKITIDGVQQFSREITYMAQRMVAAQICLRELSEIAQSSSENAKKLYNEAVDQLFSNVNGSISPSQNLSGQRRKSRNRFVPPGVAPAEPANSPSRL